VTPALLRAPPLRRWRETAAWLAIAGTLVATGLTAWQVWDGWSQRRAAAERAVRDHLVTAAVVMGGEASRMSGLEVRALLWPVLGTLGRPAARPLTLDEFARAGDAQFAAMGPDAGASRPGYFRLTRAAGGAWEPEIRGALAGDGARVRTALREVFAHVTKLASPGPVRLVVTYPSVGGEAHVVAAAAERAADGRVVALFGVTYLHGAALRQHVRHVLDGVPLLPSTFEGAAWRPDAPAGGGREADNALLAVRLVHVSGARDVVTPGAPDAVWRSPFAVTRAVDGTAGAFALQVALPEDVGRRVVAAATPLRRERVLLGGVLLLGVAFAAGAGAGLRRQQRLAQARATFVAAVSHELRTPLAHVNALSETLLLGRAESPEQAERWLRAIHREGQRLSAITENVLLHARGERHALRAAPQRVDAGALARDVACLISAQAAARSARVVVDDAGAGYAWLDGALVRQLLLNLLDNALKFGPAGQTVTLRVATRAGDGDVPATLHLTVDDEGPGVPPADRARIWQPFARLRDDAAAPAGTGLGLSVVRQVVGEMGGTARVEDAPGGGARFAVVLPAADPDAARDAVHDAAHEAAADVAPVRGLATSG
jgi:signal transduction histidine kinase